MITLEGVEIPAKKIYDMHSKSNSLNDFRRKVYKKFGLTRETAFSESWVFLREYYYKTWKIRTKKTPQNQKFPLEIDL